MRDVKTYEIEERFAAKTQYLTVSGIPNEPTDRNPNFRPGSAENNNPVLYHTLPVSLLPYASVPQSRPHYY